MIFADRINFWDFGGNSDYNEIRAELYGQTQVTSRDMLLPIIHTTHIYLSFEFISRHACWFTM